MSPNERNRNAYPDREAALVDEALRGLAGHTASLQVPEDLQHRLMARAEAEGLVEPEPRTSRAVAQGVSTPPSRGRAWMPFSGWAFAGAMAALMLVVTWGALENRPAPAPAIHPMVVAETPPASETRKQEIAQTQAPLERAVQPETPTDEPVVAAVRSAPAAIPAASRALASQPVASRASEPAPVQLAVNEGVAPLTSQFIPVNYAAPLRADEFVQAVRVRIGAGDLWRLGVPVTAQRQDSQVTADFLLGEDGRPRAVRLVSTYAPAMDGLE